MARFIFLANSWSVEAEVATFALSGQSATFKVGYRLTAVAGTFALSGQSATFRRDLRHTAALGTFALNGQSATLRATRRAEAQLGSFTLTGQAAGLYRERRLSAAQGSFTFTGYDAGLTRKRTLAAAVGTFVLTGAAVRRAYSLRTDAGAFALIGQDAHRLLGWGLVKVYAGSGGIEYAGAASTRYKAFGAPEIFEYTGSGGIEYGGAATTRYQFAVPLPGRVFPRKRKAGPQTFAYVGSGGFAIHGGALVRFEPIAIRRIYGGRGAITGCRARADVSFRALRLAQQYTGSGGLRGLRGWTLAQRDHGPALFVACSGRLSQSVRPLGEVSSLFCPAESYRRSA